jgi:hypothetical protein
VNGQGNSECSGTKSHARLGKVSVFAFLIIVSCVDLVPMYICYNLLIIFSNEGTNLVLKQVGCIPNYHKRKHILECK